MSGGTTKYNRPCFTKLLIVNFRKHEVNNRDEAKAFRGLHPPTDASVCPGRHGDLTAQGAQNGALVRARGGHVTPFGGRLAVPPHPSPG